MNFIMMKVKCTSTTFIIQNKNFIDLLSFKSSEDITHIAEASESENKYSESRLKVISETFDKWKNELVSAVIILALSLITLCIIVACIKC